MAEIAAETMDNYLMFDKRMRCRILKKKDVPKAIKTGKLYAKIPRKNGRKIKDAKIRFQPKSEYQEKHQLVFYSRLLNYILGHFRQEPSTENPKDQRSGYRLHL